jgi:hypothetical protein
MMSAAQQLNYAINAASYLRAAKRGNKQDETVDHHDHHDYDRDIGNEYDIQQPATTRRRNTSASSTTKKSLVRRSDRIKQQTTQQTQMQQQQQKNNKAVEAAAILASIADAAVTRSQKRNQNKVTWTDHDRATAAQAAAIAVEVAAEAAKVAEGKKKKERSAPYWTRYQENNRSKSRFQKEMGHNDVTWM